MISKAQPVIVFLICNQWKLILKTLLSISFLSSQKSSQPPTPKNTPFFMTPPLSPPYETLWSPVTTSTYPEDLMSVLNGTVDTAKVTILCRGTQMVHCILNLTNQERY